jgi:hypothetical protein
MDQTTALEEYLTKKRELVGPIQEAERHLERRIGELLGPAEIGANRHWSLRTRAKPPMPSKPPRGIASA